MAAAISKGTERPCKVCGVTIYFRRMCNACCIATTRSRDPHRVAGYRANEQAKRAAKPKAAPPLRYCADCNTLIERGVRCVECGLIRARAASLAHSMSKHDDSPRDCKECGTEFRPVYGQKRKAYCSSACSKKHNHRTARLKGKAKKRAATVEPVNPTRVFMRDGWRCHLCSGMTDSTKRGSMHPNAPELDHIVPLSKGGEHSYANTACAHKKCNAAKSDRIIGQPSLLVA